MAYNFHFVTIGECGKTMVRVFYWALVNLLTLVASVWCGHTPTKITCDEDYACTVKHLTLEQLDSLSVLRFKRYSVLWLVDAKLPTLAVSVLEPSVIQLNIENSYIHRIILPENCTLKGLTLKNTDVFTLEASRNTLLCYFFVENSEIVSLTSSLANLTSVQILSIRHGRMYTFDFEVICSLKRLNAVELISDRIESISLNIPQDTSCSNVSELDLSSNSLTTIYLSLFNHMTMLKELSLSSNKISRLDGFLNLSKLIELDISSNQIKTINLCAWNVSSIKNLFLARNKIDQMFDCIEQLSSLKTLDMSYNRLIMLDLTPFAGLSLWSLNLFYNQIAKIENPHAILMETSVMLFGNPINKMPERTLS